jgi:hypothetical protein
MRPTFLIAEPEPAEALSSRKLIVETAKFNVITAHSALETAEAFATFPNVHAVIIHSAFVNSANGNILATMRKANPDAFIIVLRPSENFLASEANEHLSSYDPEALVNLLRARFGDPRPNR